MYFDDRESGDTIEFVCDAKPADDPPGYICELPAGTEKCKCTIDPVTPFSELTYDLPDGVTSCPTRLGPYPSCTFTPAAGTVKAMCTCTLPLRTDDLNNNGFCLDYVVT